MIISHIIRNSLISAAFMLPVLLLAKSKERTPKPFFLYSLSVLCFTICMAIVFSLTGLSPLSGFHIRISLDRINLIPFNGMARIVSNGLGDYALRNLAGNLLMFAPMGFFAPLLYPRLNSAIKVLAVGCGVSLAIECTQLFLMRGTDIDDLLLNGLGTLIGYLFFALCRGLFPRLAFSFERLRCKGGLIFALCILIPFACSVSLGLWDGLIYRGI